MADRIKTWRLLAEMADRDARRCQKILDGFEARKSQAEASKIELSLVASESSLGTLSGEFLNPHTAALSGRFQQKIYEQISGQDREIEVFLKNIATWTGLLLDARQKEMSYRKLMEQEEVSKIKDLEKTEQKKTDEFASLRRRRMQ